MHFTQWILVYMYHLTQNNKKNQTIWSFLNNKKKICVRYVFLVFFIRLQQNLDSFYQKNKIENFVIYIDRCYIHYLHHLLYVLMHAFFGFDLHFLVFKFLCVFVLVLFTFKLILTRIEFSIFDVSIGTIESVYVVGIFHTNTIWDRTHKIFLSSLIFLLFKNTIELFTLKLEKQIFIEDTRRTFEMLNRDTTKNNHCSNKFDDFLGK